MLTPLQKQCRVQFFEENLGFYDSLKNCNRWWKCGSITGILKQNTSPYNENLVHPLPRSFRHTHQVRRSWQWYFEIWRKFCMWTTGTQNNNPWGCLCCCASESKEAHQGRTYEGDKGCPASSLQ
jgi:hypothetical protein